MTARGSVPPLQLPPTHGLDRAEWVRRFTLRLAQRLDLQELELEHIAPAELETWPEQAGPHDCDWYDYGPEEAADENLSNWSQ